MTVDVGVGVLVGVKVGVGVEATKNTCALITASPMKRVVSKGNACASPPAALPCVNAKQLKGDPLAI